MEPESNGGGPAPGALASLRRFVRPRAARERCEICDAAIGDDHAHLIELSSRRLLCACEACALLFSDRDGLRFRRVPRRVRLLTDFRMTDGAWEALQLPINLAFFVRSAAAGETLAMYPSPAGATQARVSPEAWKGLEGENPSLHDLESDVEALLVNRVGEAREYYRVGIDECYKLVGLIRTHWRGLSGGQAAWDEIGRFFADLKGRESHA